MTATRKISNLETVSISVIVAAGTTTYKLMTVIISGTDCVLYFSGFPESFHSMVIDLNSSSFCIEECDF